MEETNAITKNNKNPSNYNILQKPCSGSTHIARTAPGGRRTTRSAQTGITGAAAAATTQVL
jgi:predicted secreted protein